MKVLTTSLLFIFILIFCFGWLQAQPYLQIFTFQQQELKFDKADVYDQVYYQDLEFSRDIGAPQLPVKIARLAIPSNKEIANITIRHVEREPIEGNYHLFPVQPPQVLSNPKIKFVEPNPEAYTSSTPYPAASVQIGAQGSFSGYSIVSMLVYPLQYVPSQKQLIFNRRIEVEISYQERESSQLNFSGTTLTRQLMGTSVKSIVQNRDQVVSVGPSVITNSSGRLTETHLYVIITSDQLSSSFQALADWKTRKGLSAKIVTISWINSNYTGVDVQEKIRNFIIDAYQNWGTLWVLLGGDTNVLPDRKAFAMDCEYGPYSHNYIPCDLYFSDLDGDWNANGNNIYGEVDDNIDMYPDVFVGRASVENQYEANAFVDKVLTYEKNPPNGHELNMLFLAEILWNNPYTNSGLGKNHIDSLYVPPQFDPITKLYEALGNENRTTVINALNAGQNIINHDGHANESVMGVGSGYIYSSDMDNLTNSPRYGILFSIGCWPAAIDEDCIAEHFLTNPNGGGVAFIGNSRYGWGSPGNPLYGYSDRFDQQFFNYLFMADNHSVGSALAAAKAVYVPFSAQENVYRWCEYETNLLGDPEMPVWTDAPRHLTVSCPAEVPAGNSTCQVTVTDLNAPVQGAMVCLMQDTVVYETALTGLDGQVSLDVAPTNPAHPMYLTVTAKNFVPYQDTLTVMTNQPYVHIDGYATNGSPDGLITPGETINVDVTVKNYGSMRAQNVWMILRSASAKITMIDSVVSAGDILPGNQLVMTDAFSFQAGSALVNGEVIHLSATISDTQGTIWTDLVSVTGATPVIACYHHQVSDSLYGDGDGFIEPGERITLRLIAENSGLLAARQTSATLTTSDPNVTISNPNLSYGNITPSTQRLQSTELEIGASCPAPSFPQINLQFQTSDGYQFADSIYVPVGQIGFYDDMENGDGNWTHSGSTDLWHLSTNRVHSGSYSWYCGNEGSFQYNNYMQNDLEAMPVLVGENARLSFWAWYDFPNYGTDGFYVEVNDGSGWQTLDFIGSGGALGTLNTGNDWLEYTYDLSHLPKGTTVNLRFRFVSDNADVAEGVYIDDVSFQQHTPPILLGVPPVETPRIVTYQLFQNYPNPFNPSTTIKYSLKKQEPVKIEIFDIRGALIRVLVDESQQAGEHQVVWDGKNRNGRQVGSGIYFYRLRTQNFIQTRRMILLQ